MLHSPLRAPIRAPIGNSVSSSFVPAELGSDLIAHWCADDTALITLSTTKVTAWADRVGGLTVAQGTDAARPTWSATGYNSASPGVTFDGTDDILTVASIGNLPVGAVACEMYMVVDQSALAADATVRHLFTYGGGNANTSRTLRRTGANFMNVTVGTGAAAISGGGSSLGAFTGRFLIAGIVTGTVINGLKGGAFSAEVACVPNTDVTRTVIGASSALNLFHQGVVRDIIVTKRLGAASRGPLISYLSARV